MRSLLLAARASPRLLAPPRASRAAAVLASCRRGMAVSMRGAAASSAVADVGARVESDTMGKIDVSNDVYWCVACADGAVDCDRPWTLVR